jgi:uncharacterized membrane protein YkoI
MLKTALAVALSMTAFTAVADDDDWKESRTKISRAKAVSIAQSRVPGRVIDVDFENDDGRAYYEIEIRGKRNKHEIKVDANTGRIISNKVDYDDDDDDDDDDD